MSVNPTYYSEDVKRIEKIEFSVFRNKDVKQYSAVSGDPFGIDLAESYENYEPKKGGLVDLRLGTCDIYLPCTTCGENSLDCPGHFGHTELAEPVFHFGFLNHLKNILQCVCLKCSNLLVEKSDVHFKKALTKKAESRFKEIKIMTKNVQYCYHCGVPVPKIKREVKDNGSIKIMIERDVNTGNEKEDAQAIKKIKESLSPRDCYNILRNIAENDCYLLGFNPKMQRPEDLIIEKFPIPPVVIRPTAKVDFMSAATMEDALTLKISDIITANKRVRQQMEKETISNELSTYNQDIFNLLQYHVATYFDNESVSLPRTEFKTGGRPTKSISDRIKGKAGRVRSNLMGKRVDFSARSVITSDPYIDIDQVGVPKKIAMELTIPEEVTPYNIKYLTGLVKNGRDVYPGANFVLRVNYRDGKPEIQKIDLKYRKKAIRLNFGDVVERHSVDGDYVLFNRQPTLHKPSMMGHKIQVIDNDSLNTFRMNVSVCKPYNADFDGDEMNIHLAQSIQARNELKRIANVQYQIVGTKDSSPIIGCQQDTLSGAYMLTEPSVRIKGWEVANILCNTTSDTKLDIEMDKEYTGSEVFSHIIPVGINNTKKSGDKVTFQIVNGKLTVGYLDKSSLSFAKNSIIHFIWDKFGPSKTRRFIDDSQRLVLNYLLLRGQTVGFKDTVVDDKMNNQIQQVISNKILESKYMITQFENDTDQLSLDVIESALAAELAAVQANVGQMLMSHLDTSNFFWASAKSGAKGSAVNVAQVSGVLGQNNVDGARIKKKVEGRSLIYWHKDDDTPEARGFIKNSFLSGLRGYEFFYNATSGREGLIDTAIKSVTWETPIVIIENRQPKYTEIGKWIDGLLDSNPTKVQHFTERQMELMDMPNGVFIPTTDYNGNVTWGAVSAITRHDPGTELYEIKTNGGRTVTVTESKSLLVWNNKTKQFKEMLTPEIKVGDFVPVTAELNEPPIVLTHINVADYLPKTEYIYGSDYYKAIELMNQSMEGRDKIQAKWWEENNGKQFTLPYTKKSSLQRCTVRSNQENIKDGYVYPYGAVRSSAMMPEQFELNESNGIFIGLFLSEGSISHESVRITNINENIKNFVKEWFNKHSIKWTEEDKTNKIGGQSTSIRGYSAVLTRFLTNLVGCGAENKYVPSEAFVAPESFIIGLLNGYFSGDGCVTKNSIDASSASKRLIEGINMLCSRIGVFGKVYMTQLKSNNLGTENIKPSHRLRISAQWANKFSEKVTLLEENRNKKMKEKKWSSKHLNFETFNNVVLDEIKEINLIDISKHPKVYDLTIPSTFNFGLANGLQVRDTAQTGYIQRQLIKGLEDLSIRYDGTNRNARGIIIQTVYGENGINQATQTELQLNILSMDNKTLASSLGFSPEQIKKLEKAIGVTAKELTDFNTKHLEKLKNLRDEMRELQARSLINYKVMEEKFMLPVNLFRITQDYSNKKEVLELKPQDITNAIENFLNDYENRLITTLKPSDKYMKKDDRNLKFLLEVALNEYLAPVKCIFEYGLNKKEFDKMMKEIKMSFIKAIIEPGEMVGIIAAQSVGEPTSQMTLNTKHFAGVASKSSANMGVSRIQELLHFSKNIKTPQMMIYFKDTYATDRSALNKVISYFKHLSIRQLISSAEVYYDVGQNDTLGKRIKADNVSSPFFVNNQKAEISSLPFVFRIKFDIEKMLDKETTLLDIKTKFISHWYKNYTNLKNLKKNEKEVISRISRCAILSNSSTDKEQIIHIRFSMSSFNYNIITEFLRMVFDDITLKGIENIESIDVAQERVIKFDKETGEVKTDKEYVVYTSGINFEKMRMMKGIDFTRTKCNDVATILRLYGIEATRQILLHELTATYQAGGSNINQNHLSLLIDQMCHLGEISSIDRHGLSKIEMDPIARASFEKTMDHFVNAALFNEKDQMKSVSSRIAIGRVMSGGTGIFDLMLDTKKLENSEYTEDETGGRITFQPLEEEPLLQDIMKYEMGKTDFFVPVTSAK